MAPVSPAAIEGQVSVASLGEQKYEKGDEQRTGVSAVFRFAKIAAMLVSSRFWMVALEAATGAAFLTAGSADAEARVPNARTAKDATLANENIVAMLDHEERKQMIKRMKLAEMKLDEGGEETAGRAPSGLYSRFKLWVGSGAGN